MKRLTFRGGWVAPILAGSKTTTIRRPTRRLPAAGDTFALICRYHEPPFALATVRSVLDLGTDELTEAQARADGFDTLAELVGRLEDWADTFTPSLLAPTWRLISFDLDQ